MKTNQIKVFGYKQMLLLHNVDNAQNYYKIKLKSTNYEPLLINLSSKGIFLDYALLGAF